MPWHYKHPNTFPAYFGATLKAAHESPNEPFMLGGFSSKSEAEVIAEKIRHYKWCIRQAPIYDLQPILEDFNVRTFIHNDGYAFILYLVVKPTKVSDFISLNPDLAREILKQV